MAPKDRADQIEQRSPLRLPNKIADASPSITSTLRYNVKEEIEKHRRHDPLPRFFLHMATFTSLLPPHWESFPSDLKMFVEKEMFDPVLRHVLESEGLLNWSPSVRKLHPLITPGDGNCLLHAVSLAMWAMEDDELVLRTALYRLLREDRNEKNRMRWQRERIKMDAAIPGSGLIYNSADWNQEWEMVKEIASPEQRVATAQALPFESLEQFHIFMLANMLRRPIIVVAQDMMRSQWGYSLQPQNLHGIYLPLNWDPALCYHYPILLGFHQNHFTPLVCTAKLDSEEDTFDYLFPIVHRDFTPMTVHFLLEDEEKQVDSLLHKYLIIEGVMHIGESFSQANEIQGARLVCKNDNPSQNLMIPYLQLAETHYRSYLEKEYGNGTEEPVHTLTGGKAEAAYGKGTESAHPSQGQPRSLPSSSESQVLQQAQNSWSGSGAPVAQPSDVSRPSASRNPPFKRELSLVHQTCKTEGCIYYRSVSTGEYCHECFQKRGQSGKCQGERCLNPAEQGCQGLCRVCFDQKKLIETPVTNATAPPLSKMSLDPASAFAVPSEQVGSKCLEYGKPANILATKPLQMLPGQTASSSGYTAMAASRGDVPSVNKKAVTPGHAQSSDDDLNSMIVHQKLATKKCIMPECLLTGHPSTNDMCSKCYADNLKVAKEVEKTKQIHQPMAANIEPSALHEVASATSGGASAYPQIAASAASAAAAAAAAASEPSHQKQKASSKYTVKKNICASAGCDGVRLVDDKYLGYCFSCYNKNTKAPPQVASRLDQPVEGKSQLYPKLYQAIGVSQLQDLRNLATNPVATTLDNPPTTSSNQVVPTVGSSGKRCRHHLCNELAAPPKYVLCNKCAAVVVMFQEEEKGAGMGSFEQQAVGGSKQEPGPSEPTQPKEASKPTAQSTAGTKAPAGKTVSGFKNVRISRVKCQVPGGCADDMFGDPDLGDLCSRCFAKMSMRRTRGRVSPPTCHAETQPTPSPVLQYHTAPLHPSPRPPSPPPRANTEVIFINRDGIVPLRIGPKRSTLPANYQKCARSGCYKQANIQILEGFCNDCHQVYRQQGFAPKVPMVNPDQQVGNRGHFAQSSQSTVPEAWTNPQMKDHHSGEEKILNIEFGAKVPPVAEPNRTDMRCLSVGCTNYGNPRCQGYCNSCFRLIKN